MPDYGSRYVVAHIGLEDLQGNEDSYEVGAVVEFVPGGNGWADAYSVGEPQFSAPGCALDDAWLAHDPQGGGVFASGWSDKVCEVLMDAYIGSLGEPCDLDPDEYDNDADDEYCADVDSSEGD